MKLGLFLGITLASTLSLASQSVCTGTVLITSIFAAPMERDATVTIQPSLAELKSTTTAQVTVDVGGEPMNYTGVVDLTGVQAQKQTDAGSGDIFTFKMKVLSPAQISYQATFFDSKMQEQGSVKESTLDCR